MEVIAKDTRIELGLQFKDVAFIGIVVLAASIVICIILGIVFYCLRRK